MTKTKTYKIIESIILIVIGILIACSIINSNILNYVLGAALLVYGLYLIIASVIILQSFILPKAIVGGVLAGIGIAILASYMQPVSLLVSCIVVGITAIGVLFLINSILRFAKHLTTLGVTEAIIGVILLTFGLMFICWADFKAYLWLIFGVLLAIYGVYCLVVAITNKKN